MTRDEIKAIIDSENGEGYSETLNLNGYVFKRNNSFIIFEMKVLEGVRVCHIKYIYFDNVKDLIAVIAYAANFWQGNKIAFLFLKEKSKTVSAIRFLESLNFRKEVIDNFKWKGNFHCKLENTDKCKCLVYAMYK